MERTFYMVWREGGDAPSKKHEDQGAALLEAERLARMNEGVRFHVLMAVSWVRTPPKLERGNYDTNDIPF